MNKQKKLDDFLREKVDVDLSHEYREEDWNKAFNLINAQKNEKVFWTFSKKAMGILAILIAFLFAILSKESHEQLSLKTGKTDKPANNSISQKVAKKSSNLPNEITAVNSMNAASDMNQSTPKPTSNAGKNNNVGNISMSHNNKIEENKNTSTKGSNSNFRNSIAASSTKELNESSNKISKKRSDNAESNLNEDPDYAENVVRKTKFSLDKINPFKKIKTNNNINDNYRNLQVQRREIADTNWIDSYAKHNTNEDSKELKKTKPYAIHFVSGITGYKPFSGNLSHSSAPVFGPMVGLESDFYLNKQISINASLVYSERGGLNSAYYISNTSGDSSKVQLTKLRTIEIPIAVIYKLSKKSSCFGGLAMAYYVDNQTNISTLKAEGIKTIDAYATAGYLYEFNNKLSFKLNTMIGFRDVTNNKTYKSNSREDNVGLRLSVRYKFFSKE
jgi:hypothetical protein